MGEHVALALPRLACNREHWRVGLSSDAEVPRGKSSGRSAGLPIRPLYLGTTPGVHDPAPKDRADDRGTGQRGPREHPGAQLGHDQRGGTVLIGCGSVSIARRLRDSGAVGGASSARTGIRRSSRPSARSGRTLPSQSAALVRSCCWAFAAATPQGSRAREAVAVVSARFGKERPWIPACWSPSSSSSSCSCW